jgi:hypothetical protein
MSSISIALAGAAAVVSKCPRQESNLRAEFRKLALYPLSYGGAARPR